MNEHQQMVFDFHKVMGQPAPAKPTLDGYPFKLRVKLIMEEALEFATAAGVYVVAREDGTLYCSPCTEEVELGGACGLNEPLDRPDWADMIDDLCDLLYVTYGAFVAMGVDAVPFMAEVQKANLAKLWEDGKPRQREDGKIQKPANWTPPDIEGVLKKYLAERQ